MHNSGNCWQISFAPQFEASPLWEEFLEEYFEVVCDNYGDDGSDNYVGYLRNPFDEADFRRRAAERKLEVPPYCVELLKSDNWLKDNVIRFAPLEVGEFLVYGVHEEQQPQTDRLPLRIYAATAFGSEHQTTKSCLLALSDLYHQNVPHRKSSMSAAVPESYPSAPENSGLGKRRSSPLTSTTKRFWSPVKMPKTMVWKT